MQTSSLSSSRIWWTSAIVSDINFGLSEPKMRDKLISAVGEIRIYNRLIDSQGSATTTILPPLIKDNHVVFLVVRTISAADELLYDKS